MTAEELQKLGDAVHEASNDGSGPIWVLLSVMIAAAPIIVRYLKKAGVKAVTDVVQKTVEPIKELIETRHKENERMYTIMEMHIDELKEVKVKQGEHSERIAKLEGSNPKP